MAFNFIVLLARINLLLGETRVKSPPTVITEYFQLAFYKVNSSVFNSRIQKCVNLIE